MQKTEEKYKSYKINIMHINKTFLQLFKNLFDQLQKKEQNISFLKSENNNDLHI
jgi:hypothetical protein